MTEAVTTRPVQRFGEGSLSTRDDQLVVEGPMEIRLQGVPLAVLMRTPGRDEDLVRGFALTEGIIFDPAEIEGVEQIDEGDRYAMHLAAGLVVDPEQFRRNAYTTSSCGVCGKASLDAVRIAAPPLPSGPAYSSSTILGFPRLLRGQQATFDATGGLHGAALVDLEGSLLDAAEDVGRHNAVDKVIGRVTQHRWPLGDCGLVVSGRISFEITQKAAVAGIPLVAGVSAASSLAVELAEELGMTLVGFVRAESFVVYAGAERITSG
jgi:FdhD protein